MIGTNFNSPDPVGWEEVTTQRTALEVIIRELKIDKQVLQDWLAKLAAALRPFAKVEHGNHVYDLLEQAKREGVIR